MPRSFSERNSLPSPPGAQLPRASIQAEYGQRGLASPYPLNPGSFRLQPVLGGLMDVFEESARYDHHPVAITHDQVTGRYRHPAALDRLSDPAMPTLVGPGHACSAGKDRQILFSKLIDIPEAPSMTTPRIPATSAATVSTSDPKPGHSSTGHPSGHRTMRSPSSVTLSSQRTRALTNAGQGGHP